MPFDRLAWVRRIKQVEREFLAVQFAVDLTCQQVQVNSAILSDDLRPRDLNAAANGLESTYLVRLFAIFEGALRERWRLDRSTEPTVRDLIDSLATRFRIGFDQLQNAHTVRQLRNTLVHEGGAVTNPTPIDRARSHLCTFISRLDR